jgi:hypothetical protein
MGIEGAKKFLNLSNRQISNDSLKVKFCKNLEFLKFVIAISPKILIVCIEF